VRISLSVWSTRIAAQDFTIWRFQLRRLRQKMVKNGLPDPVENVRGRGSRLLESIRLNAKAPIRCSIRWSHEAHSGYRPIAFMKSKEAGGPQAVNWHVTRTLLLTIFNVCGQGQARCCLEKHARADETEMSSRRIPRIHQCIWADAVG
jgi:hypothetical protein